MTNLSLANAAIVTSRPESAGIRQLIVEENPIMDFIQWVPIPQGVGAHRWFEETAKWVDAVVKTMAAESSENNALISGWTAKGRDTWLEALTPMAQAAMGEEQAGIALEAVKTAFNTRAGKLGLKL